MTADDEQDHPVVNGLDIRQQTAGALGLTGSDTANRDDMNWRASVRAEFDALVADLAFVYDTHGAPRVLTRGKPREDR